MKINYFISVLYLGYFALSEKLLISLYYETLCIDSVTFITNELYPFWKNGGQDYIDIHLIPYGKAFHKLVADQTYLIDCQHGPNECAGNRAHACVINAEEKNRAIDIIACAMRSTATDLNKCIEENNGNVKAVDKCISTKGDKLLAGYADETYRLKRLYFVQTIGINNITDQTLSDNLRENFSCTIINKLKNLTL